MRLSRIAPGISGALLLLFCSAPASADPPAEPEVASPPQQASVSIPPELVDHLVEVTTSTGVVKGKLVEVRDDDLTLVTFAEERLTLSRADVVAIRAEALSPPPRRPRASAPLPAVPPPTEPSPNELPPGVEMPGPPKSPSPWGFWGGVAIGPAFGPPSGPAKPAATFTFDLAGSFHFAYLGVGAGLTMFSGVTSFTNETTQGTRSAGVPIAFAGYAEIGLAKGLFFPLDDKSAFELRPGVGYGVWATTDAQQGIDHCVDCDTRSFDQHGAHYVRFQLGAFWARRQREDIVYKVLAARNGIFHGGVVSYQEFFYGGDPRVHRFVTFGYNLGWGP
ncbi:MAG: hypothetical protein U0359_06670 [Byssovorax sp.]